MLHKYRLLKGTSWGIAINLTGEIQEGDGIEIPVSLNLSEAQQECLRLGFRMANRKCRLVLSEVEYNPTDYQDEGLAAAVVSMLTGRQLESYFNPIKHQYVYNLSQDKGS